MEEAACRPPLGMATRHRGRSCEPPSRKRRPSFRRTVDSSPMFQMKPDGPKRMHARIRAPVASGQFRMTGAEAPKGREIFYRSGDALIFPGLLQKLHLPNQQSGQPRLLCLLRDESLARVLPQQKMQVCTSTTGVLAPATMSSVTHHHQSLAIASLGIRKAADKIRLWRISTLDGRKSSTRNAPLPPSPRARQSFTIESRS